MKALAEWILRIVVPKEDRRHILDELDEMYQAKVGSVGGKKAESWRRKQIWGFILRALPVFWWKRPLTGFLGLMSNRDGRLGTLDILRQDLRFAFRSFLKRPAFALAAILILGVGIGATTTIYSVVDTVLLRPLPYPEPAELVQFGGFGGVRPLLFSRWHEGLDSYEGIGGAWNRTSTLTEEGRPQTLRASLVTPDLLPILGATPHLGRLFQIGEFGGEAQVALLSHGFWQRNWGEDPTILGRSITLDGRSVVVEGILSPDFVPPEAITGRRVDVWLPFDVRTEETLDWSVLSVVARLRDGVGRIGAYEELSTFTDHLALELPNLLVRRDGSIRYGWLIPLQVSTMRGVGGPLMFLMWSVILMLLIACANVANLLLAHGTSRSGELALRGALGARRGRIVRQLLTESITLALAGGVVGVFLAVLGVKAFLGLNPGGVPRIDELAVDPRVLLFALLASIATGLIFGTVPALQATRKDVAAALQEGGTGSSPARQGRRARGMLVVAEIALALVLLSSAGLLFRSLMAVARTDPGFQTENLVTVPLHMDSGYDATRRRQFTRVVMERLESLQGTEGVAVGLTVPFEFVGAMGCCIAHEVTSAGGGNEEDPLARVQVNPVTPGYFQTLGAELAYGREFGAGDEDGDGLVLVINEPAARYFFGEGEAVGRSLKVGGWGDFTVVGVVRGVKHFGAVRGVEPSVYVPWGRWGAFSDAYRLMVRSTSGLETLSSAVRQAVWAVDPNIPVEEIVPMEQRVEDAMASQRFLSILVGAFATLALILASGGIYASMLYSVGQRKKEMGIRLAMGAGRGQLVHLVMKAAFGQVALGIGMGLAGSVGVSLVLQSWLFGVAPVDGITVMTVVAILGGAASMASLIPALKAARADPLETLKVE
jgi:putative ABC transport system permease protein